MEKLLTLLCNLFVIQLLFKNGCSQKINIIYFENCDATLIPDADWPVQLTSVQYEKNPDETVDIIHGTYEVKTLDTRPMELLINFYKCPLGFESRCNMNMKQYVEQLDCIRFHEDSSGLWHMISNAMSGSKCGEELGVFELNSAKLRPIYLEQYIKDKADGKYRSQMLFHKKGDQAGDLYYRGCVDMEFEVIF